MLVVKYIEPWAVSHQQRWHSEALQTYGERVVLRHRWNIEDFANNRVDRCSSCSSAGASSAEVRLLVTNATGGSFTITFMSDTSAPIPYNCSAAILKNELEALTNINVGDVSVFGDNVNGTTGLLVKFAGGWAYSDEVPSLVANGTELVGTGADIDVSIIQAGVDSDLSSRMARVYKQSGDSWCDSCYGVGFEGGFEPIVYVTYALIRDQQQETTRNKTGVIQREDPRIQLSFEPQAQEFDLIARVETWDDDNKTPLDVHGRFLITAVQPVSIRTGPGMPLADYPETASRTLIVGQLTSIEILPREHPMQMVPLTPAEDEIRITAGIVETREVDDNVPVDVEF